jgi:hypothetical protein
MKPALCGAFDAQFDFTAQRAARIGVSAPILRAALCNLQAYEINRSRKSTELTPKTPQSINAY